MKKLILLLSIALMLSGCSSPKEESLIKEPIIEETQAPESAMQLAIEEVNTMSVEEYERQDKKIRDSIYFCVRAAKALMDVYAPDQEDWQNTSMDLDESVNSAIDKLLVISPPEEYRDYHDKIIKGLNHMDYANDLIYLASSNNDPGLLDRANEEFISAVFCFSDAGL